MKEFKWKDNWGGGNFSLPLSEVLGKRIVIIDKNNIQHEAFITKVIDRHGSDYDHGREEYWKNVDYIYEMPHDTFERNTTVLSLFKRDFKIFIKDE